MELRQSTAVTVQFGPFVDKTDGVTPETGLATAMDNATTGIRVSKNGAVMIDRNSATVPAHDDDGYYRINLSATDTNTLGSLFIQYEEAATCLPMWREFQVVTANYWDTKYSTDQFDVNVTNIAANTITATSINADAITGAKIAPGAIAKGDQLTGLNDIAATAVVSAGAITTLSGAVVNVDTVDTVTTNNDKTGYALSAAGVDDIWDELVAGHTTIGTTGWNLSLAGRVLVDTTATGTPTSTTLQLTAGSTIDDFYNDQLIYIVSGTGVGQVRSILDYTGATKTITVDEAFITTPISGDRVVVQSDHVHPLSQIADAIWDEVQADHTTAGSFGETATEIASILADTNELQTDDVPGLIATAQADLDIITGATGVNLLAATQASIDAIEVDTSTTLQAELDGIQADTENIQSRLPAALIGGRMDSDVEAINNDTVAAVQLSKSANQIISGACEGTPTTTVIQTDLAETQDDIYIGRTAIFTSGAAKDEATDITDYTGATGTLTVTALANAPSAADTFIII